MAVVLVPDMVAFATHLPPCHRTSWDSMGGKLLNFLKNVQFWGVVGLHGALKDKAIYKRGMWRRLLYYPSKMIHLK